MRKACIERATEHNDLWRKSAPDRKDSRCEATGERGGQRKKEKTIEILSSVELHRHHIPFDLGSYVRNFRNIYMSQNLKGSQEILRRQG